MHTTPVSLLERLRHEAEPQAWAQFVRLYTPLLHYWAHRLGLSDADAADLVQDVLVALVQKLPAFRYDPQKSSFRGWLRVVLLNQWRAQKRRPSLPVQGMGEVSPSDLAEPDPTEAVGEAEYRQYLARRALELMQAEFQYTTWKACWEHLVNRRPAAQVAKELGITPNAVYIAKSRVLRRLREELKDLMD